MRIPTYPASSTLLAMIPLALAFSVKPSARAVPWMATGWTSALPLPIIIGTNNVVTNAILGTQRFYRLSNP